MTRYLALPLGLTLWLAQAAHAEPFSPEAHYDTVYRTWDMGWVCVDTSHRGMNRECGHFITAVENEYLAAAERFHAESERIGHLMLRTFSEEEWEDLAIMQREINELYVYADRLRQEALSGAQRP